METMTMTLAEFFSWATAKMDEPWYYAYDFHHLVHDGNIVLFTPEQIDGTMRILTAAFYKCYGGWNIEIGIGSGQVFTDKVTLTAAS